MAKYVGSTVRSRNESDREREREKCNGTEVITMEWNVMSCRLVDRRLRDYYNATL